MPYSTYLQTGQTTTHLSRAEGAAGKQVMLKMFSHRVPYLLWWQLVFPPQHRGSFSAAQLDVVRCLTSVAKPQSPHPS